MTQIVHTYSLALADRQAALLDELHLRRQEDLILQSTLDVLGHLLDLGIDIGLQSVDLDLYGHHVIIVDGLEGDQVVTAQTRILHKDLLHLHWEDIDTLDDEHIVGTTLDTIDTTVRTSALTFARNDAGEVARAIP